MLNLHTSTITDLPNVTCTTVGHAFAQHGRAEILHGCAKTVVTAQNCFSDAAGAKLRRAAAFFAWLYTSKASSLSFRNSCANAHSRALLGTSCLLAQEAFVQLLHG